MLEWLNLGFGRSSPSLEVDAALHPSVPIIKPAQLSDAISVILPEACLSCWQPAISQASQQPCSTPSRFWSRCALCIIVATTILYSSPGKLFQFLLEYKVILGFKVAHSPCHDCATNWAGAHGNRGAYFVLLQGDRCVVCTSTIHCTQAAATAGRRRPRAVDTRPVLMLGAAATASHVSRTIRNSSITSTSLHSAELAVDGPAAVQWSHTCAKAEHGPHAYCYFIHGPSKREAQLRVCE